MFPKKFVDDNQTTFEKGPFVLDSETYDYKLEDTDGTDYCTVQQMKVWEIRPVEIIEE